MNQLYLFLILSACFANSCFGQTLERRPLLGIAYELAQEKTIQKLPIGVEIKYVVEKSSAAQANLKSGDIIVQYQDAEIHSKLDFKSQMRAQKTGDVIKLKLIRNGELMTKSMVLTQFPLEINDAFETIYDHIEIGENKIRTLITKPKTGHDLYPAVYIIQGIGCGSVENSFKKETGMYSLVDSLSNSGFMTIRMERTGSGDSQGTPCNSVTFIEDLENFRTGLKKLRNYPNVDTNQVFIIGLSMGGIMAPIIAKGENTKGIVVYGTGGKDWFSYELDNTLRQAFLERIPHAKIGELMKKEQQRLHYFFTEQKSPNEIRKIDEEMGAKCEDYPLHYSYFQEVSQLDPYLIWSTCSTKVMAIHGDSDFVSSGPEHQLIANMVNVNQPGNGFYKEFPKADHWMLKTNSEQESFNKKQDGVNHQLVRYITNWIQNQL